MGTYRKMLLIKLYNVLKIPLDFDIIQSQVAEVYTYIYSYILYFY